MTSKQQDFIEYYADPGSPTKNNAYQAARKAGYAHNTARNADSMIVAKQGMKEGIEAYKAKVGKEMEHNRQIAVEALNDAMSWAKPSAEKGGVQAIQAYVGAVRELNAISYLHSTKVQTEDLTPVQPTPEQEEALDEAARVYKLKITGRPDRRQA